MSDIRTRLKKSTRRAKTNRVIERQKKIAKAAGLSVQKPHRYAKMHALNCGIPGCVHCANPRKVWGEKTFHERQFDEACKLDAGTDTQNT
jgi:hypothetical protein